MTDAKPVLFIPGKVNEHALMRLAPLFDVLTAETLEALPQQVDRKAIKAVATFMAPITPDVIDGLPALEIVASFGVGYDHVDAGYAAKKGVTVTHTPGVLDDEVADTTIALLLNTLRELPRAEAWLRDGRWVSDGSYHLSPLTLRGRTIGIYGLGRIGKAIARRLEGFDVPIHYHNRNRDQTVDYQFHATLLDLAAAVDTLISVVPGTAQTTGSVDAEILRALGSNGVFINVGRGSVADEPALADALVNRTIAAAGLDVFADEPHVPKAILEAENAVLLPHVASASVHTRRAIADLVVDNLIAWFDKGKALTVVPECNNL